MRWAAGAERPEGSGAVAPGAEQDVEVGTVDDGIAVQIIRGLARETPATQEVVQVGSINDRIAVDIGKATTGLNVVAALVGP